MEIIALFVFLLLFFTAIVLPIMNRVVSAGNATRVGSLERRLHLLGGEVQSLRAQLDVARDSGLAAEPKSAPHVLDRPGTEAPEKEISEALVDQGEQDVPPTAVASPTPGPPVALTDRPATPRTRPEGGVTSRPAARVAREEPGDWFAKLAIWVGGVALLMAGFFMIKFSIDSGWLTPLRRVWLTALFGSGLCVSGFIADRKTRLAANRKIGQALAGAGVACLYFAVYAAVHLYGFLSPGMGFAGMVGVTAVAVGLSLRNGAPVALMGFVGGFATPLVMRTGTDNTIMLFSYLYVLYLAAQYLCLRKGWWALALGAVAASVVWAAAVIVGFLGGGLPHADGAMLFLMGLCGAVVVGSARPVGKDAVDLALGRRALVWGGGVALALVLASGQGFPVVDLAMFSVLSLAALGMGVWRPADYAWAPWLGFGAVVVAVIAPSGGGFWRWLLWPLMMHGIFFAVAHGRAYRRAPGWHWFGMSLLAAGGLIPLLFVNEEIAQVAVRVADEHWLLLCAAVASALVVVGERFLQRDDGALDRQSGVAHSGLALGLLGMGLLVAVPLEFLGLALGGLWLAAVLLWIGRDFGWSEWMVGSFGGAWMLAMTTAAGSAVAYFVEGGVDSGLFVPGGGAMLGWLVGLATAGLATRFMWGRWDKAMRWIAVGVLVSMGGMAFVSVYQWIDLVWVPASWSRPLVMGGLTAVLSLVALAVAGAGERDAGGRSPRLRHGLWMGAAGLATLVSGRVFLQHVWQDGAAGSSVFFNALLWQLGVPFVGVVILAFRLSKIRQPWAAELRLGGQILAMAIGFVWATFLVRDVFGAAGLFDRVASNTEWYAISVVWLLVGIGFQAVGLARSLKAVHIGSLIILLLTVGKVFLFDAAELDGLYRVFSFLGLGLALLGIGFFYNKVVFGRARSAGRE